MTLTINKAVLYLTLMLVVAGWWGCRKSDRLNEKPISTLNNPNTLGELQELLENSAVINLAPGLGDVSSDNYYLTSSYWMHLPAKERNAYIWAKDIFNSQGNVIDWNGPYEQVFYSNVILRTLETIPETTQNRDSRNYIKGSALFIRANAFYNLSQLFAGPYDPATAITGLGIPLRLKDNILEKSVRSSIQQTYDRIRLDAKEASKLLPPRVDAQHPNRPSKAAAMALLSRTLLSMRLYEDAGLYADSCLQLHNRLLNYNTLNKDQYFPFPKDNPEIIFYSEASNTNIFMAIVNKNTMVDSVLYGSYADNDLRRHLFYQLNSDSLPFIRSSYTGNLLPFAGMATDEQFLIRAECKARTGNMSEALHDLNHLLQHRYKSNTFIPIKDTTVQAALSLILLERRKELPFRNLRWTDLRRLNKESSNIELKRQINDTTYELQPNHIRYILPIPPDVITLSDMPQNLR